MLWVNPLNYWCWEWKEFRVIKGSQSATSTLSDHTGPPSTTMFCAAHLSHTAASPSPPSVIEQNSEILGGSDSEDELDARRCRKSTASTGKFLHLFMDLEIQFIYNSSVSSTLIYIYTLSLYIYIYVCTM